MSGGNVSYGYDAKKKSCDPPGMLDAPALWAAGDSGAVKVWVKEKITKQHDLE